jgi:hypothetical protein
MTTLAHVHYQGIYLGNLLLNYTVQWELSGSHGGCLKEQSISYTG